jgi:hypothetical protein
MDDMKIAPVRFFAQAIPEPAKVTVRWLGISSLNSLHSLLG